MSAETIYVATDRETVVSRMRTRRGSHSDDFVLAGAIVAQSFDDYEPPTPTESPPQVIG